MPEKACSSGKDYYNDSEAVRYTECAQIQEIQRDLTGECLSLLSDFVNLSKRPFLLNVGSGSGLCGSSLSQHNLEWIGSDISRNMLENANPMDEHLEMDCFIRLPFRNEVFDGAISVSAIQWVCVSASPEKQSVLFMKEMFRVLKYNTVLIAQCYPNTQAHASILQNAAVEAGFCGDLYTSFPHQSKAKKKFMCLYKPPKGKVKPELKSIQCCLSWPFQIPCIMSWLLLARNATQSSRINPIKSRIENEHFDHSCRMIRLLRRAAGKSCDKSAETLSPTMVTSEIFSCFSSNVCPCGGVFSCHVCTDNGIEEAKDTLLMLFNSFSPTLKHCLHHGHSAHVSADIVSSWRSVKQSTMTPFFQLEIVREGGRYTSAILSTPKVPSLLTVMFEFQPGDDHGRLYEFIHESSSCVVGIDVRSFQKIYSVAVLLYAPSLTHQIHGAYTIL